LIRGYTAPALGPPLITVHELVLANYCQLERNGHPAVVELFQLLGVGEGGTKEFMTTATLGVDLSAYITERST
jgi:hypothetical protein